MQTLKSLADFERIGAIVSEKPVPKQIKWKGVDPSTYEEVDYEASVLLKKPNSGLFSDIVKAKDDADEVAMWIGESMFVEDEKGKLKPIGFDMARRLDVPLRGAIWKEIKLLAGLEKKTSPASTNSSANSSKTESADQPSPKPVSDSAPKS